GVGLLLGAIAALVFHSALRAGSLVAAALTVGIGMLISGALHEDGLADTADALGGAYDREKLFEILKDSRVGSFGAAALVVVVGLRVALLARLGGGAMLGLLITQSLSRLPLLWMMLTMDHVSSDVMTKSRPLMQVGLPQAVVATVWPAGAIVGAVAV